MSLLSLGYHIMAATMWYMGMTLLPIVVGRLLSICEAAGRFLMVKRTPGISTTDLVGRMLLCTRGHFIKSLTMMLAGGEGPGIAEERRKLGEDMRQRIKRVCERPDRTAAWI
jgi:hypothetical protein